MNVNVAVVCKGDNESCEVIRRLRDARTGREDWASIRSGPYIDSDNIVVLSVTNAHACSLETGRNHHLCGRASATKDTVKDIARCHLGKMTV